MSPLLTPNPFWGGAALDEHARPVTVARSFRRGERAASSESPARPAAAGGAASVCRHSPSSGRRRRCRRLGVTWQLALRCLLACLPGGPRVSAGTREREASWLRRRRGALGCKAAGLERRNRKRGLSGVAWPPAGLLGGARSKRSGFLEPPLRKAGAVQKGPRRRLWRLS